MVFHWSLGDSKSLQVSRTLLSIQADLNDLAWIVSICPPISNTSNPLFQAFKDRSKCANHNWYHRPSPVPHLSQFSSKVLVLFSFFAFFVFPSGMEKSTRLEVLYFFLIAIRPGLLAGIRWSVCNSIIFISSSCSISIIVMKLKQF